MNNILVSQSTSSDFPIKSPDIKSKTGWNKVLSASQVVRFAVLLSAGVSLSALFGLLTGRTLLTHWISESTGMVFESAIGTLVASAGIWGLQRESKRLLSLVAILLQLLGWSNLFLTTNWPATHPISFLAVPGIRLTPESAIAFIMVGTALGLLSRVKVSVQALWAVGLLGVGISGIGMVTMLAYASGLASTSWWGRFSLQMALPASVSIFGLGAALVAHFFRVAKASRHLSIAAAILAIPGLLLLFASVDAAVLASSDAMQITRVASRKNSAEIGSIQALVDFARKSETAQRAYLLTGDHRYLTRFNTARQGLDQAIRDGDFRESSLLKMTKLKSDELDETVALERRGQHEDAVRIVESADGLRYMEGIEIQAKLLIDGLQKTNLFRRGETQKLTLSIQRTIVLSFGLAVLFALGAVLLVGTEMRDRSRIEAELREKEAGMISALQDQTVRAEEASVAKSSFLASMSHEIRTPMNAILGMADMLWESELSEAQRHYVEIFRRAGGSLLVLINDILDFSKIESGNFSLENVDFDLHELVDQVAEVLHPAAQSKMLALLTHIEAGTPMHTVGDPARLQQILLNLLSNAIKFTNEGEVSLRVSSMNTSTHAHLEFEVSDTGIGIASDKLSCIFEDFTQAESSTTRRFGGTGLGLGISRRLVRLMCGELRVRSEVGRGSTFSFDAVLPIGIEQKEAVPLRLDEIVGKRVLIVDNNGTNRTILSEMCSAWGMYVTSCGSGAEAIELTRNGLENQPFALSLVDRVMPEMDGFETVQHMRVLDPKIAVLIVSSDSQAGDIARCRELGFCGHLIKPLRRRELLRQIVKALGDISDPVLPAPVAVAPRESLLRERRVRVLVAEDSEDNRFLLQAYCQGTGFEPTFAEDGEKAVAAYQAASFDLVLMDVQMPTMDGLTATRQIRSIETTDGRGRTPILALTANALPKDVALTIEAGCDAHLTKPISKKTFLTALERWQSQPLTPEPTLNIDIPDGMEELAIRYMGGRKRELPVLKDLLARSEFEGMRRIGHNMKGTGTSYGFPELTRLGREMEEASKGKDLVALSRQLIELASYTDAALHHLALADGVEAQPQLSRAAL